MVNNTNPYCDLLESLGLQFFPIVGDSEISGQIWDWNEFLAMMIYFSECTEMFEELTDDELLEFQNPPPVRFASGSNAEEPYIEMIAQGLNLVKSFSRLKEDGDQKYLKSLWCSPSGDRVGEFEANLLPCDSYKLDLVFLSNSLGRSILSPSYFKFSKGLNDDQYYFVSFHPERNVR